MTVLDLGGSKIFKYQARVFSPHTTLFILPGDYTKFDLVEISPYSQTICWPQVS